MFDVIVGAVTVAVCLPLLIVGAVADYRADREVTR